MKIEAGVGFGEISVEIWRKSFGKPLESMGIWIFQTINNTAYLTRETAITYFKQAGQFTGMTWLYRP
jgi:hypothetical protein